MWSVKCALRLILRRKLLKRACWLSKNVFFILDEHRGNNPPKPPKAHNYIQFDEDVGFWMQDCWYAQAMRHKRPGHTHFFQLRVSSRIQFSGGVSQFAKLSRSTLRVRSIPSSVPQSRNISLCPWSPGRSHNIKLNWHSFTFQCIRTLHEHQALSTHCKCKKNSAS